MPASTPASSITPGQRQRFRRNLCIWLAHKSGRVSSSVLADAFVLSRARVKKILEEMRELEAERRPPTLFTLDDDAERSEVA